jgi:outer membrane lipoprotein-sorting protein
MRMRRIFIIVFLALLFCISYAFTYSIDEIIEKLEESQNRILDITADVIMEIDVGGEIIKQEMQMWRKGDKTKIEFRRSKGSAADSSKGFLTTVIMDKEKMVIKPEGKESQVIDLKKTKSNGKEITPNFAGMEIQKGVHEFLRESNATITKQEGDKITLCIVPKDSNLLMQKLEMVVDMARGIVTQQKMYSNMGISLSRMVYEKKDETWVLKKFTTVSNFGLVGTSTIKAVYNNTKINKGIEDEVFNDD